MAEPSFRMQHRPDVATHATVEPSLDLMVCILAIFKAGGVYVRRDFDAPYGWPIGCGTLAAPERKCRQRRFHLTFSRAKT